jgi:hypothetical protein
VKTLMNASDRAAIEARLAALRPDSPKRWGRMSVGGMVCHLTDAFEICLGERPADRVPRLHERTLIRLVALHTPMPWPKGVKTVGACDQEVAGTPPGELERDKARLHAAMERFVGKVEPGKSVHPIFGTMSAAEWGHWGWRHMDHHLRQFGA